MGPAEGTPQHIYYTAAIELGAAIGLADGALSAREIRAIRSVYGIDPREFTEAPLILNRYIRDPAPVAAVLRRFAMIFRDAPEVKETFLFSAAAVALADGRVNDREVAVLRAACDALGVPHGKFAYLLGSFSDPGDAGTAEPAIPERTVHLEMLGLDERASGEQIRAAHRRLVKRYHPDLLRAQKLPEGEIMRAGRYLARINASYHWLRRNG